ncbi:hypothetical protein [Butyrivibrio sp. AE2032]|uniref:hypothetical protein n=1 Tax=Butyrivibrio sp. AE2032 TaxID=1458463 RepID=UPI0005500666|nr:hypothetical protein [Butyrivibrio sp. AE2032]
MDEQLTMNQEVNDGRFVVPYDKGRKTITFYDTFVDINGDVIKYDDIAVIQSGALNSSSMIYFYFSKSFTYNFDFTTYDGAKHKFKRSGYSAYGIGTYKRIKEEFETVSPPFYRIVVRSVGERLINRIENGATANICGLVITKDKITYEKRKKTIVIDRSNFDRAINSNSVMSNFAQIYVRDEKKPVFNVSLNEPNARLIVPIVNYFFEYRPENAAGPAML